MRQVYDTVGKDGHVRTITQAGSSGAGAVGVDLDVARSQLWLHEVSPVLGYMNPVMGVNSEYQIFIGNVAPTGSEVAEGGAHTENNPTLTRLRRTPTIIHYPWSLSGNLVRHGRGWPWGACLRTAYRASFLNVPPARS